MTDQAAGDTWLPAWFSEEQIDTVLVAFPDVYGRLMGKRLTHSFFTRSVVPSGTHACNYLLTVDMDMNPLEGFRLASWDQGYGDFHVVPDLLSLRRMSWTESSAIVLADLEHEDGRPVEESPRRVLRRQTERLAERGMNAQMGSELEFYLFGESYEAATKKGFRDLERGSDYLIDYHLLQTARDENVLRRIRNELSDADIPIEGSKGEWGRGQHEVNLLYGEAMRTADRHVLYKHATKEIASQEGRAITFMAKWATEEAGSSFHLHSSLWDADVQANLFADLDDGKANERFRQFLGGLLKYGRELCYFFAPTVNSYKRYQAASWAPTSLAWAHDNRTTGFRAIGHGPGLRIENRSPGADANPYLAFAATIAAGLRGIEEELDCGPPFEGNAYEDSSLPRLPASLGEAAELLDGSSMARESFSEEVIDFYVHTARHEARASRDAVTDWERARYFERI